MSVKPVAESAANLPVSSQWWASNGHTLPHSLCTSSLCTPCSKPMRDFDRRLAACKFRKSWFQLVLKWWNQTHFKVNSRWIQAYEFERIHSSLWINAYETFYNDCNAIRVIGCGECMKHLRIGLLSNLRVWRGPALTNNHWLDCLSSSSLDNDGTGVFIWRSAGKKLEERFDFQINLQI